MAKQKVQKEKKNKPAKATPKKPTKEEKQRRILTSDTIPYQSVFNNGIFKLRKDTYSKSYLLPDIGFKGMSNENQWEFAEKYRNFANAVGTNAEIQLTLYNRFINMETFKEQVHIQLRGDELDADREEYNRVLDEKLAEGKNNIELIRILTLTIQAENIQFAEQRFNGLDAQLRDHMGTLTGNQAIAFSPMTTEERLQLLNEILRGENSWIKHVADPVKRKEQLSDYFSLERCKEQGMTTKDVIAPDMFEFLPTHAKIDERYMSTHYIRDYPTQINGTILTDLMKLPYEMLFTVYLSQYKKAESLKLLKNINTQIKTKKREEAKADAKEGYFLPQDGFSDMADAEEAVENLRDHVTKEDGKLYDITCAFTIFANSREELKRAETTLSLIGNDNAINIGKLLLLQETGFRSTLPVGNNELKVKRKIHSDTVAGLIPFDVQSINQPDGMYYGRNAISKDLILYNRANYGKQGNACIFGTSGSGKSFTAKREMENILINPQNAADEILIIDPEGEYLNMAREYYGEIITISSGSDTHVNPFDLDIRNEDKGGVSALKNKVDFVTSMLKIMLGSRSPLTDDQLSILDECILQIYEPYIEHLKATGKSIDQAAAPTLSTLYEALQDHPKEEAERLVNKLFRFVDGSMNLFNCKTNVNLKNRFVVFNIQDMGSGVKELALYIILENVWNRIIENKGRGIRTWVYIDEFYLIMRDESSAKYIAEIWKRVRKWGGYPCAITQDVEDLLQSSHARTILNNSAFVMLMQQTPQAIYGDHNSTGLQQIYRLTPNQCQFLKSAKAGSGLMLLNQTTIIETEDDYPKNTKFYRIATTNPQETSM